MAATLTWLDLSKHGLALGLGAAKDTPEFVVVGRKAAFDTYGESLKALGFEPRGAHYYLPQGRSVPGLEDWQSEFSEAFMNPETMPGRVAKDKTSAIYMVENGWVDKESMFPAAESPESPAEAPEAPGEPSGESQGEPSSTGAQESSPQEAATNTGQAAPGADTEMRWLSLEKYGLSVQYRLIDTNDRLVKEGTEGANRELVVLGGRRTEGLYLQELSALGARVDMDKTHGQHARIVFESGQKTSEVLKAIHEAFPESKPVMLPKDFVAGRAPESDEVLSLEVPELIDWSDFQQLLQNEVVERVTGDKKVAPFTDDELRNLLNATTQLPEALTTRNAGISGRRLQETLEAATVAVFRDLSQRNEEMSIEKASRIDQVMPKDNVRSTKSQNLQQFSTPLALSYTGQDIISIDKTTTVWEPTVGNGSLVSMADPANVGGAELDRERLQRLQASGYEGITHGDANRLDVPKGTYDRVTINPPFGAFADGKGAREFTSFVPMIEGSTQFPKMKTKSQDQYIALRHLEALNPEGLGFMILGADHPMRFKEGEYSQETRNFLQLLNDTHDVHSMHYVSGNLYNTHGAGWPLLMIVTAGRREQVLETELPEKLPVIASLEELDAYRVNMKEELAKWDRSLDEAKRRERENEQKGQGGGQPGGGDALGDPATPDDEESPSDEPETPEEDPVEKEYEETAVTDKDFDAFDDEPEDDNASDSARHAIEDAEVSYEPRSGMKSLGKMIPANMAAPVMRALDRVELHHGNIDSYVAEELGWTLEQLEERLAAEQVDAVGLAMHQGTLDRGFILGDNTGIGKGRVMAAMVAWGIKRGKKPIFMTSKAGLFADIMRDFRDIGEEDLLKPLVMNDIPTIKDRDGVTVLKNTPQRDLQPLLDKNTIGKDHNCVFMTYSQINREIGKCKKAQWLSHVAEENFLLLDEVHNGAGNDSNTGENLIEAIRSADFTLGSSGTYAKRPDNLGLYIFTSMFDGTDSDTLIGTVSGGGTEYQELLSTMLAESGQMIVRSHPQAPSPVPKLVDVSYDGLDAREVTDRLAVVLDNLTGLSEGTQEMVRDDNEGIKKLLDRIPESEKAKAKQWGSKTLNFGSIMHNVVRQATFAMKTKGVVDAVKESLADGKRVVVGLDNTMETFLQHAADSIRNEMLTAEAAQGDVANEGAEDEVPEGRDTFTGIQLDKDIPANISYRDTIFRLMERLITIEHTDRWGNVTKDLAFNLKQKREDFEDGSLMERIASGQALHGDDMAMVYFEAEETVYALPEELPASPIDYIRQELANLGITSTEITGRSLQIDYSDPDNPVFKHRTAEDKDRLRAADEFNNGDSQVVFVNSSGAEGVSLHGHRDFKNNEDRRMLFAQIPYDIAVYNQLSGRIDRSGAREGYRPDYELLGIDVPAEKRQMANLIRKDSSLKANTRADREGKVEMYGVPMMNRVGDQVTYEVLKEHPESNAIEEKLGINLKSEGSKFSGVSMKAGIGNETGLYSKVMSRLSRMKLSDAEPIVEMMEDAYLRRIEQLDQAGINPLKTQILDLKARFTEEVYEIVPKSGPSSFQSSVDAKAIRYDQEIRPIAFDVVEASLRSAQSKLTLVGMSEYPIGDKWDEIQAKQDAEINRHIKKRATAYYESVQVEQENPVDVAAALRETVMKKPGVLNLTDDALDIVRGVAKRHQVMTAMRDSVGLGVKVSGISLADLGFEDEEAKADFVITGIKPPRPLDNPAAASNWAITLMSADGSAGMAKISLSQLTTICQENPTVRFSDEPMTMGALRKEFHDDRKGYTTERERIVLMGNLFAAAEAAKNASEEYEGIGKANPVVFTDENGVKHRGMLMGAWFEVNDLEKLKSVDFTVSKQDVALAYIDYVVAEAAKEDRAPEIFSTNAWYTVQGRRSNGKSDQLGSGVKLFRDTDTRQWKIQVSVMKKDNREYLKDGVLANMLDGDFEKPGNPIDRNMMEATIKSNADLPEVVSRLLQHHRINFHGKAADSQWYRDHLRERGLALEERERELEAGISKEKAAAPALPDPANEETQEESEMRQALNNAALEGQAAAPNPIKFPGFG